MSATLEKYIFSPDANAGKAAMLSRFFSGLLHPLIHFGHGPEFGLPGLAAEGEVSENPTPLSRTHASYRTRYGLSHEQYVRRFIPARVLPA
jgi:hypothetical protein